MRHGRQREVVGGRPHRRTASRRREPRSTPALLQAVRAAVPLPTAGDQEAGRLGLAIAALGVVGAWIVGFVAWFAIDIVHEVGRGDGGNDIPSGQINTRDLREGDCLDIPEAKSVRSVNAMPCEDYHDAEVYWTFDLSAGDYPGDDAVVLKAEQGCAARFDEFVGKPYGRSQLDAFYIHPTEGLWQVGERGVTCSVYEPTRPRSEDVNRVTGTLRNARR